MAIVIGDIHGCFKTFEALLNKLPDDYIYLVGDLIDRGPSSKKVIQFLIDHPEIKSVKGNHEEWALSVLENPGFGDVRAWTHPRNGGSATLRSYGEAWENCRKPFKDYFPQEHLDYLENLPEHLIIDDSLFLSHSSYCGFDWNSEEDLKDIRSWNKARSLLWHRGEPKEVIINDKKYFHIFGHTPVPGAEITSYYANIDTGACFNYKEAIKEGYGILTAIQYPSLKVWTQLNID